MGKKSKSNDDDVDLSEGSDKPKFQAVILADPFDTSRLNPLNSAELKLNNLPLLDYSMDCLVSNHVDEVFVVCTNDQQEKQILNWQHNHQSNHGNNTAAIMKVTIIKDTSLTNAGDALRELYKRNVIQEDSKQPFLLMFGDTITNINVSQAIHDHQIRKSKDSAAIMTLVLKEIAPRSKIISSRQDDLMIALDPTTENRILVYDNTSSTIKTATPTTVDGIYSDDNNGGMNDNNDDSDDESEDDDDDEGGNLTLTLPCSFIGKHTQIDICTNYMDTGIAICSPDVLARFEDEFDSLIIADDFVTRCVAEEEEGLQSRIHAHICRPEEYAARILDIATYHEISHDLLTRWCYPIVPDNNYGGNGSDSTSSAAYKLCGHPYLYKMDTATMARSSNVIGPGMIGYNTKIDDDCTITQTVIGNDCTINVGSKISNSHIWDNCKIKSGVQITDSIIASNVCIEENAVISKGCVIGEGCIIGKNITVPPYTRVTLVVEEDEFGDDNYDDDDGDWGDDDSSSDDDDEKEKKEAGGDGTTSTNKETDPAVVGPDGKGHAWKPESHTYRIKLESMGFDRLAIRTLRQEQQMAEDKGGDDGEFSVGDGDGGNLEDDEAMENAFSAYTEGAVTFEDRDTSLTGGEQQPAMMIVGRQKGVDVIKEMKDICLEFEDNPASGEVANIENLAIELNSYKFSQNATYSDCTMASILAVLEKCDITRETSDGKLVSTFTNKIQIWAPLVTKLSVGLPEEKAIIHGLEHAATVPSNNKNGMDEKLSNGTAFRFLLQILHDKEVLSEEAILEWADERRKAVDNDGDDKTPPAVLKLFQLESVQDFLEWLEDDEEDDDSDDDDDDDDSE